MILDAEVLADLAYLNDTTRQAFNERRAAEAARDRGRLRSDQAHRAATRALCPECALRVPVRYCYHQG